MIEPSGQPTVDDSASKTATPMPTGAASRQSRGPGRAPGLGLGLVRGRPLSSRPGSSVSTPERNGVYLEPLSGDAALVPLTTSARKACRTSRPPGAAAMSPDGAMVAFVALRGHDPEGRLMVVGSDGQGERWIGDHTVAIGPTWSPDGSSLLAMSAGSLVRFDVASGAVTTIAGPSWPEGIAGGVYAPDGKHILIRALAPDGTAGLYVADASGNGILSSRAPPPTWGSETGDPTRSRAENGGATPTFGDPVCAARADISAATCLTEP